jgi:polyether ionophore transport system permease protein
VIGWTGGIVVLAVAYGSITNSINDFVQDNKALSDIVAAQGHGTIVEQYLAMSFRILALVTAAFAIQSALRVRSEETSARAEQVLATPVSRVRFAASHLAIAFGGTVAVLLLVGLTFGVSDAAVTGDAHAIGQSVLGALVFVPAVWLLIGCTMALIGLVPRASAASWALFAVCFVIGFFGQLLDLASWMLDASPFQHVPRYPGTSVDVVPLALLVAIAAGLTGLGLAGLHRRDIG